MEWEGFRACILDAFYSLYLRRIWPRDYFFFKLYYLFCFSRWMDQEAQFIQSAEVVSRISNPFSLLLVLAEASSPLSEDEDLSLFERLLTSSWIIADSSGPSFPSGWLPVSFFARLESALSSPTSLFSSFSPRYSYWYRGQNDSKNPTSSVRFGKIQNLCLPRDNNHTIANITNRTIEE